MKTIRLIFDLLFLALFLYVAITIAMQYAKAVGTTWERLLTAARESATILWGKFVLLVAGLTGNLDSICDAVGAPEVKQWIESTIGNPKILASIMAGIAVVTITARARTLVK